MRRLQTWTRMNPLGSGRSGRTLADALERVGAVGLMAGLRGSKGFIAGMWVQDLQPCAIMPLPKTRLPSGRCRLGLARLPSRLSRKAAYNDSLPIGRSCRRAGSVGACRSSPVSRNVQVRLEALRYLERMSWNEIKMASYS